MRMSDEVLHEIAENAYENAGYGIEYYAGYHVIWESEEEPEFNYAVAINKECDDYGNDRHYAIYVNDNDDRNNFWEYTDTLDVDELAAKLSRICDAIEREEEKGE